MEAKEFRAVLNLKLQGADEDEAERIMQGCVEEWKRLHMGSGEELEVISVEEALGA